MFVYRNPTYFAQVDTETRLTCVWRLFSGSSSSSSSSANLWLNKELRVKTLTNTISLYICLKLHRLCPAPNYTTDGLVSRALFVFSHLIAAGEQPQPGDPGGAQPTGGDWATVPVSSRGAREPEDVQQQEWERRRRRRKVYAGVRHSSVLSLLRHYRALIKHKYNITTITWITHVHRHTDPNSFIIGGRSVQITWVRIWILLSKNTHPG